MSGSKYLVRFDDICPGMNWDVWEKIEEILSAEAVNPILSIVPDNRDATLNVSPPKADFWDRVRGWATKGWCIAVHGYQHLYETRSSGLVGLNAFSEFAGLPYGVQKAKLARAMEIFDREKVSPRVWVAPGHSFDATTIQILKEFGVRVVSDGFYFRPHQKLGLIWVPQQLWRFRRMPVGVWTICLHHALWGEREVEELGRDLRRFRSSIVSLNDVTADATIGPVSALDEMFAYVWRSALRVRFTFMRSSGET